MLASTPIGSVVIAAHNEEATIARCLRSLVQTGGEGRFEVVVVCNGCTDRTAEVARAAAARVAYPIDVVEIDEANKAGALDVGDTRARAFPRLYLDADVVFEDGGVDGLFEALETGALAVAPAMRVDLSGRPWAVRAFYRVWLQRSGVQRSTWGSGAYAVSATGRARFGHFPDLIADDLFVHERFADGERRVVEACCTVVTAPRTTRGLLRRKVRSTVGSLQLHRAGAGGHPSHPSSLPPSQRVRRRLSLDLFAYAAISAVARVAAHRQLRRSNSIPWSRDDSR